LHVNVSFNSSWCLFGIEDDESPDDKNSDEGEAACRPYRFSGKNYSFNSQSERQLLRQIKSWSIDYLGNNSVVHLSCFTKLRDIDALAALNEGKAKDIDLLVKVLNVFERDEF
jgi:hypothetical protein